MSDLADVWLAEHHPDEPPLPDPDAGRIDRRVQLTDWSTYWRPGSNRPGTHHARAVEDEPLRPRPVEVVNPCAHCGLDSPPIHIRRGLCAPCRMWAWRHDGGLPPDDVVNRRRERAGTFLH